MGQDDASPRRPGLTARADRNSLSEAPDAVRSGLEVLLEEGLPGGLGKRAGLITNQTGIDRGFRSGVDLLQASDVVELVALFGPEHGVRGEAQAGAHVAAAVDGRSGLPVHSLYGETQKPTAEMLAGLEVLLFDIQDVGVRYATYLSTLVLAMEAAAEVRLPVLVLDRPHPLNGITVEANPFDPAFASFVGVHPLPVRHGMTIGELALLVAAERGWPAPHVVTMRGWRRRQWFDETGLPWVQPSPNLPTLDTVTLYPGTCLVEGTNISEGRGTTRPFEYVGAPWIDPFALADELERRELPGAAFRPAYFAPTFSKHAGEACGGVQVHILDRGALRPLALGVHLLDALRAVAPERFAWRANQAGGYFIDLLAGGSALRTALDAGAGPVEIMAGWDDEAAGFLSRRKRYLLYAD